MPILPIDRPSRASSASRAVTKRWPTAQPRAPPSTSLCISDACRSVQMQRLPHRSLQIRRPPLLANAPAPRAAGGTTSASRLLTPIYILGGSASASYSAGRFPCRSRAAHLGGEAHLPDILQNPPKGRFRREAHSSIRIQEGEPNKSNSYPRAQLFIKARLRARATKGLHSPLRSWTRPGPFVPSPSKAKVRGSNPLGRANKINNLPKACRRHARAKLTINSPTEWVRWRVIGGEFVTLLP
jgi:hypothetical protein